MFVRPQRPDYVYVAQQLAVDEEFKMLVNEAQTALGKPYQIPMHRRYCYLKIPAVCL